MEVPPRSLYQMSRPSQDLYSHRIESTSHRYSITIRSVDWKNQNSTLIIGDSNTGHLRFGPNKRTSFGPLMPGRQLWAPVLEDIDPIDTLGFQNIVIHCGINNLKKDTVTSNAEIRAIFRNFREKIQLIRAVNQNCMIFVSPVLPTKRADLNQRLNEFNSMLYNDLKDYDINFILEFNQFVDHDGMLAPQLSQYHNRSGRQDFLHLNREGTKLLAYLIKDSINFFRFGKGKKPRTSRPRRESRPLEPRAPARTPQLSREQPPHTLTQPSHDGYQG